MNRQLTPVERQKTKSIVDWLRKHPLISVAGLERTTNIASGTVSKAVKNDAVNIPGWHHEPIVDVLKDYGYAE